MVRTSSGQRGGKREGAGRPKGALGGRAQSQIEAVAKRWPDWSPLEHMAHVANDETLAPEIRLDAAKACAPYLHVRLAPITPTPAVESCHPKGENDETAAPVAAPVKAARAETPAPPAGDYRPSYVATTPAAVRDIIGAEAPAAYQPLLSWPDNSHVQQEYDVLRAWNLD